MPVMPAEWEPQSAIWMAFPTPNETFGEAGGPDLAAARRAWASVANALVADGAVAVTVLVAPGDATAAAEVLDPAVATVEVPLDDAWLRDTGPSFVRDGDGLRAVDWTFNGWGGQSWAAWEHDRLLGTRVAGLAGVPADPSPLVQEGGGLAVDGAGTLLLTETVQLDPGRNPGWDRAAVEAELHRRLGTRTAVWLPRGLSADYGPLGTRGHVDLVAAFAPGGRVLVHDRTDPGHPDHAVSTAARELLADVVDGAGRRLRVVPLPAPDRTEEGGRLLDHSYVNHVVSTTTVVVPVFDDPQDVRALDVLRTVYPGRRVVAVDGRDVFRFGGGPHCITQQQPLPAAAG